MKYLGIAIDFIRKNPAYSFASLFVFLPFLLLFAGKLIGGLADFMEILTRAYMLIPRTLANMIFQVGNHEVIISGTTFVFGDSKDYQNAYDFFLVNWTSHLKHTRWSILILLSIWSTSKNVSQNLKYTGIFIVLHMACVVIGLFLLGAVYPNLYENRGSLNISPTIGGNIILLLGFSTWVACNKARIENAISKTGLNSWLDYRRVLEMSFFLFVFLLLRELIVPSFSFNSYFQFILIVTHALCSILNYDSTIIGNSLVGEYGTLHLGKPCLGIMTMYIFSAFVFITRPGENGLRKAVIFVFSGLLILNILNILRQVFLFILVQGYDVERNVENHHDLYNIFIYVVVFLLWVVWYERFLKKSSYSKGDHGD